MYKSSFAICLVLIAILFYGRLIDNPVHQEFVGGVNLAKFYSCYNEFSKRCHEPSRACIATESKHIAACKQFSNFVQTTNSFPTKVEHYDNIDVIKALMLGDQQKYNFYMIGKLGELVIPTSDMSLDRAPGFFNLNKQYPEAKLTNIILGFPKAVFLTKNTQKLLMHQEIIDPSLGKSVGYAKVLYSFTIDGTYQDSAVMRVMVN